MCEPCTRRMAARASTSFVWVRMSSTQGPAALTIAFARMISCAAGVRVLDRHLPHAVLTLEAACAGSGPDDGAARSRIERVEQHQPRVVDEAVGIFEAAGEPALGERFAQAIVGEIERPCRWQELSAAEMVIKKETEPQQPGGSKLVVVRQHEAQRLDDVRRHPPQHLALDQRLAHQAEFIIFEIAQARRGSAWLTRTTSRSPSHSFHRGKQKVRARRHRARCRNR